MTGVFLKLLNMSISAGWLILAVILLRPLLKKAPKTVRCVLWGLAGLRLVCPFALKSGLSLIPSAETVVPETVYSGAPVIHSGIPTLNSAVNPAISEALTPALASGSARGFADIAAIVWLIGLAAMLVYACVSSVRLRFRVRTAVRLRENLWQSERVDSPFVLGIFRPRIYLPFNADEKQLAHAAAHENAHIKRRDHWIKPLGFVLLSVYWFNPLVWLAYVLLCRDIELACDERVVKEMGEAEKKEYSGALLALSMPRAMIAACPLAFGEVGVGTRIKTILNYKKPAFWLIIAAILVCAAVAVCFLTDPHGEEELAMLDYETILAAAEGRETINARIAMSGTVVTVSAEELARYLDEAEWTRKLLRFPLGVKDESIFLRFQLSETSGFSIYRDERFASISLNGEKAKFRIKKGDFEKAAALLKGTPIAAGGDYSVKSIIYEAPQYSFGYTEDTAPKFLLTNDLTLSSKGDMLAGSADGYVEIGRFEETALSSESFDALFHGAEGVSGWRDGDVSASLRENNYAAWRLDVAGDANNVFYYLLLQNNGELYLSYGYLAPEDGEASIRWLFRLGAEAPKNGGVLSAGTLFLSSSCRYMNPLSSYAAVGGDSGCRYTVGEDSFTIENPGGGDVEKISPVEWGWQKFPYTDEEWSGFYFTGGEEHISELFSEMLWQPLSEKYCLLLMDGSLWLVSFGSNPQQGDFIWSVYTLTPQSARGEVLWELEPAISSRFPGFPISFDMDFTEITVFCGEGELAAFDEKGEEYERATLVTLNEGYTLRWLPMNSAGETAMSARLSFYVNNNQRGICGGAIYISGERTDAGTLYTATLTGPTGLRLESDAGASVTWER